MYVRFYYDIRLKVRNTVYILYVVSYKRVNSFVYLLESMNSFPAYLDFGLDISDIDGQTFTVTVRSAIGEAREVTSFPYDDAELENQLLRLENVILRSTDLHRANQPLQHNVVESFGRALFDFILPGETRSLYNECLREATNRHRGVRLKLSIHSPRLATLPWEFLYDPRKRDYVCLNPYTPLVRYTELPQTVQPLNIVAPLRILGLLSDPTDMPVRLEVHQERDQITTAVQSLVDRGLVNLTWLEGNSWRDLQRVMRSVDEGWHIFHFIGHGGYDTLRNEGYIVLNNEDGTSHHLYASQLARLLARQRSTMRLVLLNACEGARTGTQDVLSSTAATLIASGIPAVVAMQYEITNDAAIEFANAFYEALADNLPVDAAVAEARNALSISDARSLEWGVPVLHMRAEDGRLFAICDDDRAASKAECVDDWPAADRGTLGLGEQPAFGAGQRTAHAGESTPIGNARQTASSLPAAATSSKEVGTIATEVLSGDELTMVLSAAIDDHPPGEAYLVPAIEPPVSTLSITRAWVVLESIDQLDEQLLLEASTRIQVEQYALESTKDALSRTPHSYHEFDDEDDFMAEMLEEEESIPPQPEPPPEARREDPFDINTLLNSYARRQHAFIGFDWVTIPAGYFWLGSDPEQDPHMFEDEAPQLRLHVAEYQISRVAVTNAQYKMFMDATAYIAPPHWRGSEILEGQEDHPVVNINWHDAMAFCEWAGVRLPTEIEWEKAARGPDGRLYPWGNSPPDSTRCNFDRASGTTVPVGSYPAGASPYGVYDMSGNVWEWTVTPWLDTYENYLQAIEKQTHVASRRVLRGGGFRDMEFIRCAARSWDLPNQRYRDLGFRVVANP